MPRLETEPSQTLSGSSSIPRASFQRDQNGQLQMAQNQPNLCIRIYQFFEEKMQRLVDNSSTFKGLYFHLMFFGVLGCGFLFESLAKQIDQSRYNFKYLEDLSDKESEPLWLAYVYVYLNIYMYYAQAAIDALICITIYWCQSSSYHPHELVECFLDVT